VRGSRSTGGDAKGAAQRDRAAADGPGAGALRLLEGEEEFLASVREALKEPSFETKQKVLRLVVDRIVVEDSKVVVHHVVPTGPVHLQTERQFVNRTAPS
jgi:hypothetical protein